MKTVKDIFGHDVTIGNFACLEDIKRANHKAGQHWFDPETIRFFDAKFHDCGYAVRCGGLFISSTKFDAHTPRQYKVVAADERGHIHSITEDDNLKNTRKALVNITAALS